MSILLKNQETNEVFSYSKGSDAAMKDKIINWTKENDSLYQTVNFYAKKGLRTLVFAYKTVEDAPNLENMEAKEMEKNYSLIGVTGVEDTL